MHAAWTAGGLSQTTGQFGGKESSGQAFIWHLLAKCCIYLYLHISWLDVYICAYTNNIMLLGCQVEVIEVKPGCLSIQISLSV